MCAGKDQYPSNVLGITKAGRGSRAPRPCGKRAPTGGGSATPRDVAEERRDVIGILPAAPTDLRTIVAGDDDAERAVAVAGDGQAVTLFHHLPRNPSHPIHTPPLVITRRTR
jgi:hypothetical protein